MPKSKPQLILNPTAWDDLRRVPANIRRKIITEIDKLENHPRPPKSKRLSIANEQREVRRLRVGNWHIIYLLREEQPIILGIRKRPPYGYEDIEALVSEQGN